MQVNFDWLQNFSTQICDLSSQKERTRVEKENMVLYHVALYCLIELFTRGLL